MSDYDDLRNTLMGAKIAVDPSQADGTLVGLSCMKPSPAAGTWIGVLLEDAAVDSIGQAAVNGLGEYAEACASRLHSSDLEFMPLLPPDGVRLGVRLRALGEWCSGLTYGLAVGGLVDFDALSNHSREFLLDATELTRLIGRPEEESFDEPKYTELVEYVKVGVLTLLEELSRGAPAAIVGPGSGPSLH